MHLMITWINALTIQMYTISGFETKSISDNKTELKCGQHESSVVITALIHVQLVGNSNCSPGQTDEPT